MDPDKRRKPKLPIRKMPQPVLWILENATGEQLEYLTRQANSVDFKTFINLIAKFKEYNVYEVFYARIQDAHELELLRAAKRGELAGLDALIMAAQQAGAEIQRRKKLK